MPNHDPNHEPGVSSDLYSTEYFLERCGGLEFFNTFGYDVLKPAMQVAVMAAGLEPHHRVLDVGFGRGELVAHLSAKGYDATGIDYSPAAVSVARRLYPKGRYVQLDAGSQPFAEGSFDRVFVIGTIEHLCDRELEHLMRQVAAVLRDDGRVLLTTCVNKLYYKWWTYRLRKTMARLLRALGFAVRDPVAPRSSEDESLHINELGYFDLKQRFAKGPWRCEVLPQPNESLIADRLYSAEILERAPIEQASASKRFLYRTLVFRFPLSLVLARYYLIRLARTG